MKFFFFLFLISVSLLNAQEGLIKKYYSNGIIESEINYTNSLRDGVAKFYYPNGVLKEEINYVNGRIEGDVKRFHENGKLKESFFIEEGRRSGAYNYINEDSTVTKTLTFNGGIIFVPRKEEPVLQPKKKAVQFAVTQKRNLTFEEKVVASLSEQPPQVIDTLPIDQKSGYYTFVQEMPLPVIGLDSLRKKVTYPTEAKEKGIKGTVVLYAYVNENGDVTKTEIIKGLGYGLDDAAEIAVYYTRFKPGKQMGKPLKVRTMISLEFK